MGCKMLVFVTTLAYSINRLFGKQGLPYLEWYDSFHTLPSLVRTGRESFYSASRVYYVGSQVNGWHQK